MDMILALGKEAGMSDADLILFQGHCFNHLRNTWFEAIENYLSRKLTDLLKHDLELIPPHLRVSCKISDLLRQIDKEYSFTANYSKEAVMTMQIGRSAFVLASDICHPSVFLGAIDKMRHLKVHYRYTMDVVIC
jgi:hypothetical protein